MNPNELMLGDLVYAGKNVIHVTAATIGLGKYEDLKPIPLTEEVLVKSGFKAIPQDNIIFDSVVGEDTTKTEIRIGLNIEAVELKHGAWFLAAVKNLDRTQDGFLIQNVIKKNFRYVHELQHALRLCGIEKEIIL